MTHDACMMDEVTMVPTLGPKNTQKNHPKMIMCMRVTFVLLIHAHSSMLEKATHDGNIK